MTATIDQMLVQWWEQTEQLTARVPVSRVSAEIGQRDETDPEDEDGDYLFDDCVAYDVVTDSLFRSNSGQGFRSEIELTAYSAEYGAAREITQAVRAAWERSTLAYGGSKITTCLVGDETTEQDEDGIWAVTITITINHSTA